MMKSGAPNSSYIISPVGTKKSGMRSTFTVEALIILACLLLLVSVVLLVLLTASAKGAESARMQQAMNMAENAAERFAANPSATQNMTDGDYSLSFNTRTKKTEAGEMIYATITVAFEGKSIYALDTARYASTSTPGGGA